MSSTTTSRQNLTSSSSTTVRSYDVFLSFRGENTPSSFTSRLRTSLQNAGILVFRDDDETKTRDRVSASVQLAIEESKISLIFFSKEYSESQLCLDELEKIMECRRTLNQVVVPVFCDVDPSEVRKQTGEFGEAFGNLERRISKKRDESVDLVSRWRAALSEAASLAGFVVVNARNQRETIKNIVEEVTRLLDKTNLFVADYLVGVGTRAQEIIHLLDIQQSNDVLLLGMWGMAGIGKTTIAKAIYNEIGDNFEGRSFITNIREVWEETAKQVYLQEQLLFDIFGGRTTNIQSIDSGKNILKERLCHKRVLLVLDDVKELEQLDALCGSRKWFGPGSRIIITTRDMHILRGNRVDRVYRVQEMDESESVDLFCWHAFKQPRPREGFTEISRIIVKYSGGLPLALEVLGSYLFGREVTEWRSVLERLKREPNDQIHKSLKISYDELNDTEKTIFLDIACFFVGMDRNDVIHILNGCGLFAEVGISILVERSLVTVDDKNRIGMHHMLQDIGRKIVRDESPKEPGERSRLLNEDVLDVLLEETSRLLNEDVLDVLLEETGTKAIEGLALKLPRASAKRFRTKAFKKMKKLRLLQLAGIELDGDFEYLSRNLRWLCWDGFPSTCIPANFYQGNLVSIELENSNLNLVWKETPRLEKLKILNLSHSHYLTLTPDFSNMPNLEKLVLMDCPRLSEVSHSIGHLSKVVVINLQDCVSLRKLPRSIYKLKSLKTLILTGCVMIDKLEEDLTQMESLTSLIADNTPMKRVPFSVERLKSIGSTEVFTSFRGEDTRTSFTSHLHSALLNARIDVYKDDDSLERGNRISESLVQAIERSQISVIVFSTNYADSKWCLNELVKIMECKRTVGQVVLPVFYDVDPSEVRHQVGEFGKAFNSLLSRISSMQMEDVPKWRVALHEAASLAGIVVLNFRNESEAIKDIVEKVTHWLDKRDLFVAHNPVGVEDRVLDMIKPLNIQESNNVLLLGIWGMGGIGKTTIAKAIYNTIGRIFEGRSFVANIRQTWEQYDKQVHLQEQILCDIVKGTTTKIQNIDSGKNILKDKLCRRRVLIVLDDVNELDQLDALCGSREWFGLGSRIIITTRDKSIIKGSIVDKVYPMDVMNERESIELFSWHAFKQESPKQDFTEISRNVVRYSGGLPLALEVLGRYLVHRDVEEWICVLEKLKKIPNEKIQKKLKISYDCLDDDYQKAIFLDIACFFIGMDMNDVIHILNGCQLFPENGLKVLVERSLVIVDDKNKLRMHDLLRDMGRAIICGKPRKERSRLWIHDDADGVLSGHIGAEAVEGLTLKLPRASVKHFSTKAFMKMKELRLLQLAGIQLNGDFGYLSTKLRWLCWNGFPLKCMPTSFRQGNLISVELENSKLNLVWKETPRLENLKILNLSHSQHLTKTPDFSNLPNLEKLILVDCPRLYEVSYSIGHLNKILLINLENCVSLRGLPRSIYKLKSLKTLILSGCLMIDKLEEDLEQMESLTILIANNTAITRVPFSVVRSKSIGYISLAGYEGLSRDVFPSIIWSWMSPTNNLSLPFQTSTAMPSLVSLNIPSSSSHELSSISNYLPSVRSLWVECGSKIQLSQDVTTILYALHDRISKELESTATTSQVSNTSALIQRCSQMHISGSENPLKSLLIQMGINCQVANILKDNILQNMDVNGYGGCLLPGDRYPYWLTFNWEGSSVNFTVPQVEGRNLKTMMCIVYSLTPHGITSDGLKTMLVINHTKSTIQLYKREALTSFKYEEWQRLVSNMEPANNVEVVVVFGKSFTVKKTTVYLIYDDEPISEISPEVEIMDDFIGTASCCGLINCSFRQWITGFMRRLARFWGTSCWS